MNDTSDAKKPYTSPKVTVIGDVLDLTAGFPSKNTVLDKDFPAGSAYGDLTYS